MDIKEIQIGKKYWHIGLYSPIEEIIILEKNEKENVVKAKAQIGTYWTITSDVLSTKDMAIAEVKRRIEEREKEISGGISSVKDLLQMMLDAMKNNEFADYESIKVAKIKARELLGVELQ